MGRVNRRLDIARSAGIAPAAIGPVYLTGLARFELRMMLNSQKVECVFYVKKPTAWTGTDLTYTGAFISDDWITYILPHLSNQLSMLEYRATDLSEAGGPVVVVGLSPSDVGGNTSSDPAPFLAAKVRLGTGLSNRAGLGWKRVPGIVGSQFTAGLLTTTAQDAMQADWDTFLSDFLARDETWVIASFQLNKLARSVALATPVTSVTVEAKVTTQNSRKIGRGQ